MCGTSRVANLQSHWAYNPLLAWLRGSDDTPLQCRALAGLDHVTVSPAGASRIDHHIMMMPLPRFWGALVPLLLARLLAAPLHREPQSVLTPPARTPRATALAAPSSSRRSRPRGDSPGPPRRPPPVFPPLAVRRLRGQAAGGLREGPVHVSPQRRRKQRHGARPAPALGCVDSTFCCCGGCCQHAAAESFTGVLPTVRGII